VADVVGKVVVEHEAPWTQRLGSRSPVEQLSSSSDSHSMLIGEMGASSSDSPVKSNEWRPDKEIPQGLVSRQRQSVLLAQEQSKVRSPGVRL